MKKELLIIAGPCSVESEEQINECAAFVKSEGATYLRGGAYKPRTSPYTFQGLGKEGLRLLVQAGKAAGLRVVSEITDPRDIDNFKDVDMIQIGARNMQNFALLKEVGKSGKPVLLKRGFMNTVEELLMSAEHIKAAQGAEAGEIILCERGIRSFEPSTRFTLDVSCIAVVKSRTNYRIIADPSHAAGSWEYVKPLALASLAAGADGIITEVHPRPEEARSDGAQSLNFKSFHNLMEDIACFTTDI